MNQIVVGQPRTRLLGLRALRAPQWLHLLPICFTSVEPSQALANRTLVLRASSAVVVTACALAFGYGLNAIGDRHQDRDTAKNPLAGLDDVPVDVWGWVIAAAVAAALGSLWLGPLGLLACAVSLLCSQLYGVAKAVPFAGLLVNCGIFLPLTLLCVDRWPPGPSEWFLVAVFTVLLVQNQILHERADLSEDTEGGKRTTGAVLGQTGASAAVVVLGALGVAVAFLLSPAPWTALIAGATFAAAVGAGLLAKADPSHARRQHRWVALAGGALLYATRVPLQW